MAIVLPEIVLINVLESYLDFLDRDIDNNQNNEANSFLGRVLMGLRDEKHDYFIEAKNLFSRKDDNPRRIRSRLFFDAQEANIPTIHITMPAESNAEGENSIGVGERPEDTFFDKGANELTPSRERYFETTFHIIVTSDNHKEVLTIYHVLKAMFVASLSEINLMGLENPKLGGQDIRLKEDIVPPSIFMRGISLQCSYDVTVPRFYDQEIIRKLSFVGLPIDPSVPDNGIQAQVTLRDNNT